MNYELRKALFFKFGFNIECNISILLLGDYIFWCDLKTHSS